MRHALATEDLSIKPRLSWWRGALLFALVVVKLTLILAMRSRNVTEFIYAGF